MTVVVETSLNILIMSADVVIPLTNGKTTTQEKNNKEIDKELQIVETYHGTVMREKQFTLNKTAFEKCIQ